jgi:hypothetical protein
MPGKENFNPVQWVPLNTITDNVISQKNVIRLGSFIKPRFFELASFNRGQCYHSVIVIINSLAHSDPILSCPCLT